MQKQSSYTITAKLWIYPGEHANWHFLTIPKKESALIKKNYGSVSKGWGSLPVSVTIKKITWETSIFPDNKSGTYLLPVKAKVRTNAGAEVDDTIRFIIKIR